MTSAYKLVKEDLALGDDGRLDFFYIHPTGGVVAGVTGGAIGGLFAIAAGVLKAIERKIRERVGANEFANLFDRFIGGDEFFFDGVSTP